MRPVHPDVRRAFRLTPGLDGERAVPAPPVNVGVASFVGEDTESIDTDGATVSTTNVTGVPSPMLPASSLCETCAV